MKSSAKKKVLLPEPPRQNHLQHDQVHIASIISMCALDGNALSCSPSKDPECLLVKVKVVVEETPKGHARESFCSVGN